MWDIMPRRTILAGTALAMLAACDGTPLDFDMRGRMGADFDTSQAARSIVAERPRPDNRGIISYPNYQVAVARRGDTLAALAARIGADPTDLARHNGIQTDDTLRRGEVIALPRRVAEPSPDTGARTTGPIQPPAGVSITDLAGSAIERAEDTPLRTAAAAPAPQTGVEPVRHQVKRGETAFTVARLYNVTVRSLAEWNGLDSSFTLREGQYLLIPVVEAIAEAPDRSPRPGSGSPTPVPPSAAQPLPQETTQAAAEPVEDVPTSPDLGAQQSAPATTARMGFPVEGTIIREYAKGRNEGIDISAPAGTPIKAAQSGRVAAITTDADKVPIIVVKHPNDLFTVYANVGDISVEKDEAISRGQVLGKVRSGSPSYLHFEVRNQSLESVDPLPYLQ